MGSEFIVQLYHSSSLWWSTAIEMESKMILSYPQIS